MMIPQRHDIDQSVIRTPSWKCIDGARPSNTQTYIEASISSHECRAVEFEYVSMYEPERKCSLCTPSDGLRVFESSRRATCSMRRVTTD